MNRYYSASYGRFLTVDPFGGSANATRSGSWNRYSYAEGDPLNSLDSTGREIVDLGSGTCTVGAGEYEENVDCDYWMVYYANPIFPGGGGGGGGGGSGFDKGGRKTDPKKAAKVAWQYLTSVWQNCLNDFEQIKGFNATTFQNLLTAAPSNGGITWLNDTDPGVAASTIGSYGGINTSSAPISSLFQQSATAVTLPGTSDVVVGPDYFTSLTQTQQIAVAIHEALHVALGLNTDPPLEQVLQQFGFTTTPSNSGAITDWIVGSTDQMSTTGGGCPNPKGN